MAPIVRRVLFILICLPNQTRRALPSHQPSLPLGISGLPRNREPCTMQPLIIRFTSMMPNRRRPQCHRRSALPLMMSLIRLIHKAYMVLNHRTRALRLGYIAHIADWRIRIQKVAFVRVALVRAAAAIARVAAALAEAQDAGRGRRRLLRYVGGARRVDWALRG
jgi:hypothetical protein